MKKFFAVLVATLTIFVGVAQAQTRTIYPQERIKTTYESRTDIHVSRPGPSWQGNNFYDHPVAASRVNGGGTRLSSTYINLGVYQYERTSGRVPGTTVITSCGRSVTPVTTYSSTTTITRAPYVIVPTWSGVSTVGVQPSYVDNTRGGGWSAGGSTTVIHHSYNPSLVR